LAAWPLVLERVPRARLVIVGFGAYRQGSERLTAALGAGDMDLAREIALAGHALEAQSPEPQSPQAQLPERQSPEAQSPKAQSPEPQSPEPRPLRHLLAFFDALEGDGRERYLIAARTLQARVVFTGRLEHDELAELLPACEAVVVPSTFPEAFGMVAVEAAACGALPITAAHSGLAEVSEVLARAVPDQAARWLSFPIDDRVVGALAERVLSWLAADPDLRRQTRAELAFTARARWSWDGVARGVIAAVRGELDGLQRP
jgi:glycosyltransferase involved in cell wall biosynthesis